MMTEQEAIARAKQVASEQGWAWAEPALATLHRRWFGKGGRWEIFSHASGLGAKVRIVIDAETGEVLEKGSIAR
jgi:Peptidase propeptide and YPEB domain